MIDLADIKWQEKCSNASFDEIYNNSIISASEPKPKNPIKKNIFDEWQKNLVRGDDQLKNSPDS